MSESDKVYVRHVLREGTLHATSGGCLLNQRTMLLEGRCDSIGLTEGLDQAFVLGHFIRRHSEESEHGGEGALEVSQQSLHGRSLHY